jgi:hypothetical protein
LSSLVVSRRDGGRGDVTEGVEMEVIGWEWEEKVREDEGPGGGWRKEAMVRFPVGFTMGCFLVVLRGELRLSLQPSMGVGRKIRLLIGALRTNGGGEGWGRRIQRARQESKKWSHKIVLRRKDGWRMATALLPPTPPLLSSQHSKHPIYMTSLVSKADPDSDSDSEHEPDWDMLASALSPDALAALKLTMANKATGATAVTSSDEPTTTDSLPATDDNYHPPLPTSNKAYGTKPYWDDRFTVEKSFDWLVSFADVETQLNRIITEKCPHLVKDTARVLLVGCGNSPFSYGVYKSGYKNTTSIDYSEPVIAAMNEQYPESDNDGLKWIVQDMTAMTFDDNTFDIVIDKAAMDALMVDEGDVWNPDPTVIQKSKDMCECISRILAPKGIHLHISFAQPHFRLKYLNGEHSESDFGWDLTHETIAGDGSDGCFHHFLYVMQKL